MAEWILTTSDRVAESKDKILGNTTNTSFTVTLPTSPIPGDEIKFLKIGINDLILDFNDNPYKGYSPISMAYIEVENEKVSLVFVDDSQGWISTKNGIIVATIIGNSGSGGNTTYI